MRLLCLFIFAILSGCASYQPKPLHTQALADSFEARSLGDPALHAYLEQQLGRALSPWPMRHWDRATLTLAAGYYSPVLAAARAQRQGAQAGVAIADARPNPTLQFPFEYTLNHQGEGRPITTGPALDLTIETAGKRDARVRHAWALAEAERQRQLESAWKLRSQVRAALLDLYAASQRAAVLADKAALQVQLSTLLERRLAQGAASMPELRRTQLLQLQTGSELATVQGEQREARARLATAIGIPLAALDTIEFDFSDFELAPGVPDTAAARRNAIMQRADLQRALADYEASEAALQLEVARQYPDIHLGLGYTYDAGANKINFGLAGLTLPIYDRNGGAIAQADARRAQAEASVEALQAAMLNDVANALQRLHDAEAGVRRLARQELLAARQRDGQQASFAAGLSDRLELLQAQGDCLAVRAERLGAALALQSAAGYLEDALQQALPYFPSPHFSPSAP